MPAIILRIRYLKKKKIHYRKISWGKDKPEYDPKLLYFSWMWFLTHFQATHLVFSSEIPAAPPAPRPAPAHPHNAKARSIQRPEFWDSAWHAQGYPEEGHGSVFIAQHRNGGLCVSNPRQMFQQLSKTLFILRASQQKLRTVETIRASGWQSSLVLS